MKIEIKKITPTHNSGIVNGDYSNNSNIKFIDVDVEINGINANVRIKNDDDNIDFNNINLSESMKNDAIQKATIKVAQELIFSEEITGKMGINIDIKTPEGDTYNIRNTDVDEIYDVLSLLSQEDGFKLCKHLLSH